MKKKTKILLGVGALALIYFLYKRKKSVQQSQAQQPQVGVSQGEGVRDKASLFNIFTRTRYTNPTNKPQPRPQTLSQKQIWKLNQPKVPKFSQSQQTSKYGGRVGSRAGVEQSNTNVDIKQ